MAWIETHQSLREHPKTKLLARRLGVPRAQAIGHLICFWWWSMDYALDGDLSACDPEEIAVGAEWEGDPDTFIESAVASGFLDRDGKRLSIHNWVYYTGRLLRKRDANRARARESYEKNKGSKKDSTRSLRAEKSFHSADYAQSTGLPTYLPTNHRTASPVENSELTAIEAMQAPISCFVCGEEMTSMDRVDGDWMEDRGWRHAKCRETKGQVA